MSADRKKVALRAVRSIAEAITELDINATEAAALEKALTICMRKAQQW